MEPVSLTLGAIAADLVAKAADKTAERAVEGGAGVLKRFAGWLQERFSADDERDGATALARLKDAPDSPSRLRALAEVPDRRAHADAGFRSELKSLVDETPASGVDVRSIVQTAWGDQNVQTAGVVGSDPEIQACEPRSRPRALRPRESTSRQHSLDRRPPVTVIYPIPLYDYALRASQVPCVPRLPVAP